MFEIFPMRFAPILFFIACAISCDPGYKYFDYQEQCMEKIIGFPRFSNRKQFLEKMGLWNVVHKSPDACSWRGVSCEKKKVTKIEWLERIFPVIQTLSWFPASLRVLIMLDKSIRTSLPTQDLPKDLQALTLENCGLIGSLVLHRLPQKIEEMILPSNKFTGNLRVTDLPLSMKRLNLRYSPIRVVFVENGNLPRGIEEILVGDGAVETKIVGLDGEPDNRVHKPY